MADERKRTMTGRVCKDRMEKTVVVEIRRRVKDRRYKKIITRLSRFMAHDEANECKVGDMVELRESRPLSKKKRWVVTRVLDRSVEV